MVWKAISGSGVQHGLLREGLAKRVPKGAKIVLLHAVNPFGFSWDRRVNEDNADVNRNFVDFGSPPHNPAYDDLVDYITLKDLAPQTMKTANAKLGEGDAERCVPRRARACRETRRHRFSYRPWRSRRGGNDHRGFAGQSRLQACAGHVEPRAFERRRRIGFAAAAWHD